MELFFLILLIVSGLGVFILTLLWRSAQGRAELYESQAREAVEAQQRLTEEKAVAQATAAQIPELRALLAQREEELAALRETAADGRAELEGLRTELRKEREASQEKLATLERAREELSQAFRALSAEALKSNNQSFLELAQQTLAKFQEVAKGDLDKRQQAIEQVVKPVRESLDKFDARVQELEKTRVGAYESLSQQVRSLAETQTQLRSETANLVKALRQPAVRGRWGEMQLRRVAEMAGMLKHCDFVEQHSLRDGDGNVQRPDLIVRMPGGAHIVVDAKAPLAAFLEAYEAQDEETRRLRMQDHARQLRAHLNQLSRRAYWEQLEGTPDMVVLFVPGETFYSAAFEHDPSLLEYSFENRVLIASPTTLIALLRTIAYGWRQEALADNARKVSDLGAELYRRLANMANHLGSLGNSLQSAVKHYNSAVGSIESRVLVTARKFRDLEAASGREDIRTLAPVELAVRELSAEELRPDEPDVAAALPEPADLHQIEESDAKVCDT